MPPFVSCPQCACPVKSSDSSCPSCGGPARTTDGRVARAAVAVLLGLTAATGLEACAGSAPKYGVPATEGEPTATATTTESAPAPSATTVAPPPDPGPEVRPLYGIPATQGDR